MKSVVCIGGGTGQSALLRGLKQINNIELSTIVAVADNGGSTGRLRNDLNIPAMGDVRSVMVALADSEDLMTKIMNYRFDQRAGELSGHNLGNIIISALTIDSNDFYKSIVSLCRILKVKGKVYPSTTENVVLKAYMADGTIIEGESEIRESDKEVVSVFYDQNVHTYKQVLRAIETADYIIVGIGSLFTSILPNLIIDDIKKALTECKGKVIYYCNSMTEKGETTNYTVEDHVQAIERHVGKKVIDAVVISNDSIPQNILHNYYLEGAREVVLSETKHDYRVFSHSLLNFDNGLVRHDPQKVKESFVKVMRSM
ncbi:MAG: uridine diphosphate-N-acetylglucosamine-binding protein YvcK [Erysipelotrichia bacterium]|nr:uridine diphosphate-N-acetylglucosamine-binding protein YvcK [Erysipelotrichia bacterium]